MAKPKIQTQIPAAEDRKVTPKMMETFMDEALILLKQEVPRQGHPGSRKEIKVNGLDFLLMVSYERDMFTGTVYHIIPGRGYALSNPDYIRLGRLVEKTSTPSSEVQDASIPF